jgi:hypothetical protein
VHAVPDARGFPVDFVVVIAARLMQDDAAPDFLRTLFTAHDERLHAIRRSPCSNVKLC